MKFSYNFLKKYIDIKLTPEKLAELLTMHSFECAVFRKTDNDSILDVDILPNRSHDALSHYGLVKEIATLTKKPLKKLKTKFREDSKIKSGDFISVSVTEKNLCPRYIAKVLTDVKIGHSPKWLKNALAEFNINSHNNIVDILNYVMLEIGQPLHAFDYDKLDGKKIIVRTARKGEKINTLDGGRYDLDEDVLVIADSKKPAAIAGIKGGLETGISEKTRTIVIESANFESGAIKRTSRTLGLNTDAAIRFSYGIDPNLTEFGMNRVCALIQEIIPGVKIASGKIDIYPKKFLLRTIKLNLDYLNKLVGENIKPEFVKITLESLGAKIKIVGKKLFFVTVPTARLDLEIEEDLIEEVFRIYGCMNLKGQMPVAAITIPKKNDVNFLINKTRDILTGVGFSEVYNYSFVGDKDISEDYKSKLIEIQNPASEDFKFLRPELTFGLLKNIKNNFRFFEKVKFFESGKVFSASASERLSLAGIYAVKESKENVAGRRFFELKGDLDVLFENLGITDCQYNSAVSKWWHPGRFAHIKYGENFLGIIGEVNPATLAVLDIPGRVAMFHLDFEKLIEIVEEEREFSPISKFPAVIRDISILVGRETKVDDVLNVIHGAGAELVKGVDLFDYYEGEELPEGRKNLAFHIIYQAERTLINEEVRHEEEKIKNALIKELNAEIR
ncbi:phenylalanine--tRNA ligase subunit beta [Patescibacteria group bacterium]|nr:phenylalanine--tRNA ligase subunit beta [Patescibacteria group bacterium]